MTRPILRRLLLVPLMAALLALSPLLGTSAVSAGTEEEQEVVPDKRFSVQDALVHEGHTAEIDVFLSSPAPAGGITFSVSYDWANATATKADFVGGDSLFKTSVTVQPKPTRPDCGGDAEPACGPYRNWGTRATLKFPTKFDNGEAGLEDEPTEKVTLTFSTTADGWEPARDGADTGSIIIFVNADLCRPQGGGTGHHGFYGLNRCPSTGGSSGQQESVGNGAYVGGAGADPDPQGDTQGPPDEEDAESAPLAEPGTVPYVQAVAYGKSVIVMWSSPSPYDGGEPDQYVVRLKTDNKGKAKTKRVDADTNNVTFGKVKSGTHTVYVRAKNDAGGGKWAKTQVTVP